MTFTFAVDVDDTVAGWIGGFRGHVGKQTNTDHTLYGQPTTWHISQEPTWPIKDEQHFLELYAQAIKDGMLRELEVLPGASEALWQLSDAGVHIHILTHRLNLPGMHERVICDTAYWLERNNIPYRSLSFHGRKADVAADLYIDDATHNVTALREAGKEVIVFSNSHNLDLPGPRASSWAEVPSLVLERMNRV